MSDDLYATLGVARDASQEDIKRAYRRLAKELHPDLNPDKPDVAERFKKVTAAYDILSDPEKRGRYDRGEIDASGQERPQYRYYRDFAEDPGASRFYTREGFADEGELHDFFESVFGVGGARGFRMRARGAGPAGDEQKDESSHAAMLTPAAPPEGARRVQPATSTVTDV